MSRIALVKPDKARAIEDMIIMAARRGQLQEKVRGVRGLQVGVEGTGRGGGAGRWAWSLQSD